MFSINLDKELSGHVFAFLFVFARVSPVIMLLPGFGESYVSARARGAVALVISFLLVGPLLPTIPAPPSDVPGMVKLLGFEIDPMTGRWDALSGVNITLGLPIIRTSVDHGTAFDIAGKGVANPRSLIEAIEYAERLAAA